ncbi:uncharacterized protein LOC127127511 isoform X5 [Lathyrus oleraceus]|uniref:uncharacterized protein LOC127127511 isoform X5 n=1 Tax=Pisum sativum TaxID=3888 RepID=UPI0021D21879|nr:uncharacterized protein LOC127127511 isoform X5 [Pisum sativum]
MDFFAMKRKKLQSLCKKHGIPANLKNSDMAEKLSLIYKEEKNENPGSRRLRSDVNKSNVEIIVLDSDSDSEVQMEASDTVAEKDSNEKTNVSTEHLLDEEPDQSLTTSPRSEVKSSNHNIHHMVDSEEIKQVCKLDDNIYVMDEAAAMCLDASTAMKHTDEVKSNDLNDIVSHPLRSDEDKSNLEITELDSEKDIDVQMEASDTVAEKDCNERTNVSAEHLLDEEPNQFITTSPLSEVKSSDLNNLESHLLRSDEDKSNLGSTDSGTDVQMEASDTVAEKDCNERTNVSAEHLLDEEPNQFITTSPLSEVKSSDLNNLESHLLRSDEDKSNLGSTDSGTDVQMEVSDTVAEKDCNERTNVSAEHLLDEEPSQFTTTSPISEVKSSDLNSFGSYSGFGNYMMLGDQTSSERTDVHEDTDLHQGSVEQFNKSDVYHCVISQSAKTCLDVNVENILDEVHSSSFEDSDETPVQFLDAEKMVVTGTATRNAYTSGAKFESSQKMSITPASKEIVGSSAKLLNNSVSPRDVVFCNLEESVQIGADKEQVDPSQEKMVEFSPKLFNNPGTPANGGIGLCGLEENLEIGVNKENIDPNEDVIYAEPSAMVMSDNQDVIQAVSEELGNKLMEENLEIGVNKENIDSNEDVIYAEPSAMVMSDNEDVIQAVSEEFRNSLMEDEVANMEDKFDLLGDVHESVNPGGTNSAHGSNIKTALNTYVTGGDILDEVHSSSFEDSDATPVQFPKTDPLRDAETSDLNLHKMFKTATAIKNADTSGVKFESSTKRSLSLTPEKMIGSSTKLLNNSGTPTNFGFCDVEENMQIGISKENIDPNEEVMHEEPSALVMSDNEGLIQAVSEELGNDLTEDEVANVDDKFDLFEDVPGSVNPGSKKNADLNTYVTDGDILDEVHSSSFEDSDVTPVQFLTTDQLREAETSDLDVHKMFETATATKNADASGVKFESSTKMSLNLTPEKVIGSSTKLLNNSGTPTNFGFCDADENLQIGANKEQVDPSQEKTMEFSPKLFNNPETPTNGGTGLWFLEENLEIGVNKENIDPNEDVMHEEPSALVMSDNEDLIHAVSEELGNDLMEDEVANVDDKFDLLEDVPGSVNPVSKKNADLNTYVTGGDILDEVHSSSFEDSDATPVQFLKTDPLREAETSVLNLHKMFETAIATKNADTGGVKFESSTKMSLSLTPEKMIGSSTKLLKNSGAPTHFGFCDVDENLQIGRNKVNIDPSDEILHAEPSLVVTSDNEEVDLSIHQMAALEACEEEMLKSSEKTCMVADPEECIGFSLNDLQASTTKGSEVETYFESTALGDVMETCNMEGCMETNMIEGENSQEENQGYSGSWKKKGSDVDDNSGANSDEEVRADELVPAVPQSSEMESCDFGLQQLFAQGEITMIEAENNQEDCVSAQREVVKFFDNSDVHDDIGRDGAKDVNQASSASWKRIRSDMDDASGASSTEQVKAGEITMIEAENNQEGCVSAQREVVKFFDNSDVHDDIGRDGAKDVNQASSASWKRIRSDMDDASGASSIEQVKAGEITMIEVENNQEDCVSAQREVVKFFDNSDVHDDIGRDGAKDVNQASSASRKRIRSDMDNASGASSIEQVKAGEITMIEAENNQEDCVSAQREVVKFFDNSDVHDDIGRDGAKDVNQASSASRKRIRSDMDDASGASSIEQVKADTASGDQDVCPKKLDSPSKATPIASGEKNIIFTPMFNESSMMHKEMEIAMIEEENNAQWEVCKFLDTSDVHVGIGLDGAKDENQAYWASRKRKMSDVDDTSGGNSNEEVKADEFVPAVPHSSEMESCDFGFPQLFAQDTASGDEDAYQKKLDSSSKGTPTASGEKSIVFTPKLQESSMMRKKMRIEMNLSQKPATRDSVGTCDMKENIKTDKKEVDSSTVSRNKFAKRLPLQDLHQN